MKHDKTRQSKQVHKCVRCGKTATGRMPRGWANIVLPGTFTYSTVCKEHNPTWVG